MLEIIRERAQGVIAKVILGLITIPFALWGVDSYLQQGDKADVVAKVGSQTITSREFSNALKEQQARLRGADPSLLDKPEVRQTVLDGLIKQRLLATEANGVGLVLPDALLASFISQIPEFQQDGKFSQARYEMMVRAQDMTPMMLENRVRQNVILQQLIEGLAHGVAMPRTTEDRVIRLADQLREISQVVMTPEQYVIQMKVGAEEIKAYYDKNREEFNIPEQARMEYVVLSVDELLPQMVVNDEEIKKQYDDHSAQYVEPEQRRASHILIPAGNAKDALAARTQAEQLLKEIKQSPSKFEALAKQHSKDSGSAVKGGDLGFFARGAMVKSFDETAFSMKEGEISGLVQSDFGFHIIKLTAIKHGGKRTLDQTKAEITQDLKKQKALKKFAELAESFSNTVYEQSDSLKPVADALKLKIQSSPWMNKKSVETPLLSHPKLLQAAFSEDAIKLKRNTEAVEVAPNTLVAARVVEYKAASYKPIEDLTAEITKRLQRDQGNVEAVKQGKDALANLQKGSVVSDLKWSVPTMTGRDNSSGLGKDALNQIFRVDADKLPAYTGIENPKGGYILFKVSKVSEGSALDAERKSLSDQLRQTLAQEYSSAYIAGLKQRSDVSIKKDKLEKIEH